MEKLGAVRASCQDDQDSSRDDMMSGLDEEDLDDDLADDLDDTYN